MAGLYDLMLLLDPNAPDERQSQILDQVKAMIADNGTIVGDYDWGLRKMAYEMDHRGEAGYHLFQFEGANELLDRLNHTLKITDGVLRFRIIKLKPGSPPPPTPRTDAPPRPVREPREGRGGETRVAARAAADAGTGEEESEAPPPAE
jgi:small subunit ribosomal protein S6